MDFHGVSKIVHELLFLVEVTIVEVTIAKVTIDSKTLIISSKSMIWVYYLIWGELFLIKKISTTHFVDPLL